MSTVTSPTSTESPRAVSELWYTRCPVPTASSLAISQGWLDDEFARDAIKVASLRESADSSVRESHFSHTQADSFRQGGNIPPIWTRSRGSDVRLIGLSWADQYQAVVSLDPSIREPADLKGKRLGLTRRVNDQIDFYNATSLRGFDATLGAAGLTLDDAELVHIDVDERFLDSAGDRSHSGSLFGAVSNRRLQSADVLALIRGEVDAIYQAGGRGPDFEALTGAHRVFDLRAQADRTIRINNITPVALTVSGPLLDERPDLVARYVAATLRAARWASDHEVETRRIMAHEVGIAEDFVEPGYPGGIHATLEPTLDEDLVAAIESQRDFLLAHGYIADTFDVRAWIDERPLRDAHELLAADPS